MTTTRPSSAGEGKRACTIRIGAEMVELLKAHKQHQAVLKMTDRRTYQDFELVFAKEWNDLRGRSEMTLGHHLQANNFGQREFATLITRAGVKKIKFHGLRHTCATVLLASGEAVPVAAQRLGHAQASMTLDVYAHATEDRQPGRGGENGRAAARLAIGAGCSNWRRPSYASTARDIAPGHGNVNRRTLTLRDYGKKAEVLVAGAELSILWPDGRFLEAQSRRKFGRGRDGGPR